jgi:hypothetical protein
MLWAIRPINEAAVIGHALKIILKNAVFDVENGIAGDLDFWIGHPKGVKADPIGSKWGEPADQKVAKIQANAMRVIEPSNGEPYRFSFQGRALGAIKGAFHAYLTQSAITIDRPVLADRS